MINNKLRIGNFTSSQIYRLMSPGTAKTYIDECNMERRLGRSLQTESNAKPLTWGKLLEVRCFEMLGFEYQLESTETIAHPTIDCWTGSPDGKKNNGAVVIDIKCPFTLKSFCNLEAIKTREDLKKENPEYYWQLVSNGILTGADSAELIVYVPFENELNDIRVLCDTMSGEDLHKYYWISNSRDEELPFLPNKGFYENINILGFRIPEEDKEALTKRVVEFSNLLTKRL